MTEHETIAGNVYCVTCAEGCTVTDSSGQLNEECEAGKQLHITAPSGVLFTSVPATVRKVNFKNAPVKMRLLGLLGGGVSNGLPSGYLAADFLESTGTQWLRTDSVTNGGTVFSAKIVPMKYISNAPSFFGARESYPKKMFCVCLNEKKLVFRYDSKQFVTSGMLEIGKAYEVEYTDEVFRVNDVETVVSRASFENPNPLGIFSTITGNGTTTDGILSARLFYLHLTTVDALGEVHAHNYVPALNANGKPCLYDKERGKNFYNAGSGAFIVGFETVETARRLAKLPKVEAGELTVSLPAEARDAASMVPTALSIASSRGWTIIEQYRED